MAKRPGKVAVGLNLGFLSLGGEWVLDDEQRKAAWELYVELVTRVPVADLHDDEGLLREALTSLHSVFASTREILRRYGPDVAGGSDAGTYSFGYLAVALLNGALRPFLARWHPELVHHEAARPAGVSPFEHERSWPLGAAMRAELRDLRAVLIDYATLMGDATGAPTLLRAVEDTRRPTPPDPPPVA